MFVGRLMYPFNPYVRLLVVQCLVGLSVGWLVRRRSDCHNFQTKIAGSYTIMPLSENLFRKERFVLLLTNDAVVL